MTRSTDTGGTAARQADQVAAMQRIGEKSRRVVELWLSNGGARGGNLPVSPSLAGDFLALTQHLLANPAALLETQAEFWQDYLTLCARHSGSWVRKPSR